MLPGGERVEADAAEDRRQRDDHDRGVDRGHQHAERGVGQRHPLVVAFPQTPFAARILRAARVAFTLPAVCRSQVCMPHWGGVDCRLLNV